MNPNVHDFVNSQPQITINYRRPEEPYLPNGHSDRAHDVPVDNGPTVYSQIPHKKKDIAEPNMDPEVHGFANSMVEPIPWPRRKTPYDPNGSHPTAHDVPVSDGPTIYSQVPHKKKDIAEANMDPEVHGFANSMVEPIAWPRKGSPYDPNGSHPTAHSVPLDDSTTAVALNQMRKKDIANKEVRPDVYVTVHKMVNPTAVWRTNKAPESTYEDWWGEGNPPPRTELKPVPCPEELETEPDEATMKAAKIMAEERKRDEAAAKAEEEKEEKAIKAAEEEQKKIDDEEKAAKEEAQAKL